jgi:ubiquinone/menaquinone biosynthesis C-methylase UbiE
MQLRTAVTHFPPPTPSLSIYDDPQIALHYASLDYLTPCERVLFESYIRPGMAILDLGVGGGRTTPRLSAEASYYVGVDCSQEMIRTCQRKFPELDFHVADAADLSAFPDASFDAIVIAFNGLDYVLPEERRGACLQECRRVLKTGGTLMFSSHNPRSILVRPSWNQNKLRAFARNLVPNRRVYFAAMVAALTVAKSIHACLRAGAGSGMRIFRRVPKPAFWRGEGCLLDSAHGGLVTHYWTPARAIAEIAEFDFRLETFLGDDHPKRSHRFVTDWYYYVFSKAETPESKPCA